jgi:hypothetical protein
MRRQLADKSSASKLSKESNAERIAPTRPDNADNLVMVNTIRTTTTHLEDIIATIITSVKLSVRKRGLSFKVHAFSPTYHQILMFTGFSAYHHHNQFLAMLCFCVVTGKVGSPDFPFFAFL